MKNKHTDKRQPNIYKPKWMTSQWRESFEEDEFSSSQLIEDPECWSGRGLNPRPPARQTGALPTELTWQRLGRAGENDGKFYHVLRTTA